MHKIMVVDDEVIITHTIGGTPNLHGTRSLRDGILWGRSFREGKTPETRFNPDGYCYAREVRCARYPSQCNFNDNKITRL